MCVAVIDLHGRDTARVPNSTSNAGVAKRWNHWYGRSAFDCHCISNETTAPSEQLKIRLATVTSGPGCFLVYLGKMTARPKNLVWITLLCCHCSMINAWLTVIDIVLATVASKCEYEPISGSSKLLLGVTMIDCLQFHSNLFENVWAGTQLVGRTRVESPTFGSVTDRLRWLH